MIEELSKIIEQQKAQGKLAVEIPQEYWEELTVAYAKELAKRYQRDTLIKLPPAEIEFFEWLREEDPEVWQDLWGDMVDDAELYAVGIGLLPDLIQYGFPICDLITVPNYYFTYKHIRPEEGHTLLQLVLEKLERGDHLTLAEEFLNEVRQQPTDIWHFAYRKGVDLTAVKNAVLELVEGGVLLYTPTREELSDYLLFGGDE